jgi:hypothetical protein
MAFRGCEKSPPVAECATSAPKGAIKISFTAALKRCATQKLRHPKTGAKASISLASFSRAAKFLGTYFIPEEA